MRNHRPVGARPYSETLDYEDCGSENCTPQYSGNISRMAHELAHGNSAYGTDRDATYAYDLMNRLTNVNDADIDDFDETFAYDPQGRMTAQRRGANVTAASGGEYGYYAGTDRLEKVSSGMGGTADDRHMGADSNFVYDADGNMTGDRSKKMTVTYDWRGLPTEFVREVPSATGIVGEVDTVRLLMTYDGSGSRIGKRYERRNEGDTAWALQLATHYTGLGSEIRESGLDGTAKVVVSLPQGLGRYGVVSASGTAASTAPGFEFYLKNHLGSTMLVYGVGASQGVRAAYDYRAFGEEVDLTVPTDKVTENFTGKERDDETNLSNHGARMLDPMLGIWTAVDPKRFFPSPYLYMGKGYNPISSADTTGNNPVVGMVTTTPVAFYNLYQTEKKSYNQGDSYGTTVMKGLGAFFFTLATGIVPSKGLLSKAAMGGLTSAATNIAGQKLIEGKNSIDWKETATEARNGTVITGGAIGGKAIAGKYLLDPTAALVGETAGNAAALGIIDAGTKQQE